MAHVLALLIVVVGTLTLWNQFHLILREFGSPTVTIIVLTVSLGSAIFGATSWFALRWRDRRLSRITLQLVTGGILYVVVLTGVYEILSQSPEHLEGGDIALRLLVFAGIYGLVCNGLIVWRAESAT